MRILFVTPYGGYTGSEILIWQLMQELDRRGKPVAWFSRHRGALFNEKDNVRFPTQFYRQQSSFLHSIYEGVYVKTTGSAPVDKALLHYH